MFPARGTVSQGSSPMQPPCVNLNVEFTCAMAFRVSLSDSFCPMGQMYQGFSNPRLFKDRPTDGKCSGYAAPFYISAFAIAWATVATRCYVSQPAAICFSALCCCRHGKLNSIQNLHAMPLLNPHQPAHNACIYFRTKRSPVRRTVSQ